LHEIGSSGGIPVQEEDPAEEKEAVPFLKPEEEGNRPDQKPLLFQSKEAEAPEKQRKKKNLGHDNIN
jgi:hypothetical protein